ncbi:MAG: DinB family protein, partial [Ignavibacteria bacterium]
LNKEQLFKPPIEREYPIGAYLMHFGECDAGWYAVISGKEMSDEIKKRVYYEAWFDTTPELYNPPKEPLEVNEYIEAITETRNIFRDYILSLNDSDLDELVIQKSTKGEKKVSRKWIIYHLIEHEAHHRGQMFMLIRKAGFKKK